MSPRPSPRLKMARWILLLLLLPGLAIQPASASIDSLEAGRSISLAGLEHDSRSDLYRVPFGAVPVGETVILRFRADEGEAQTVRLHVFDARLGTGYTVEMSVAAVIPGDPVNGEIWEAEISTPLEPGLLFYRFEITDGLETVYYEDDDLLDGGLGQAYEVSPVRPWQISVYEPGVAAPAWLSNAIVYHISPDRFRNGNPANDVTEGAFFYGEPDGAMNAPLWNLIVPDPRLPDSPWEGSGDKLFYGGDLAGITAKLDTLQALGVTVIYLEPVFESPSNHKQDSTHYGVVDDNLGGHAAFLELVQALDAREMHLVLAAAFDHSSSDSEYFDRYSRFETTGACEHTGSPFRQWYQFVPADPPGTGMCAGDTNYVSWAGQDRFPSFDTALSDGYRNFIFRDPDPSMPVATYWLGLGVDGWALDNPAGVDAGFWREWKPYLDVFTQTVTLADSPPGGSAFTLGDMLDGALDGRFGRSVTGLLRETDWTDVNGTIPALTPSEFDGLIRSLQEVYPPEAWAGRLNQLDSLETNRLLVILDQDGDLYDGDFSDGKARQRLAAVLQMTMPGAPVILYGDEVGLAGMGEPDGGGVYYNDPYNRQPFAWDDEPGFTDLPPWRQPDASLLAYYTALTGIRQSHPALRAGTFHTLLTADAAGVYAFARRLEDDAVVTVVNLGSPQEVIIPVAGTLPEGTHLTDALTGATYTVTVGVISVNLPAMSAAVLAVDAGQDLIPPGAPTGLQAAGGNEQVTLSWEAAAGAETYTIYRSYVRSGGYAQIATGVAGTAFTDDTAANGTRYYYVVTAVDGGGLESGRSNEAAALPYLPVDWAGDLDPAAITHVIGLDPAGPISAQVYIAGVTDPPGQAQGVWAQVGYGSPECLPENWPTWTEMTYTGDTGVNDLYSGQLLPEAVGTYVYAARFSTSEGQVWTYAFTPAHQYGSLEVIPSGDTTPPPAPANLHATTWSPEHISLAWTPVDGDPTLYAYDLYRSETGGEPWTKLGRVLEPAATYTDTAVVAGNTYTYIVRALDTSFNFSAPSNPVTAPAETMLVAVTFRVTTPTYTPAGAAVYIVGDAPELCAYCDPQTLALTPAGENTWQRTFLLPDGLPLQYRYTRGSLNTSEWQGLDPRHVTVSRGDAGIQTFEDTAYPWRDPLVISHSPTGGEHVLDPSLPITVILSRYLDPETITPATVQLTGDAAPDYELTFQWLTGMTATLITIQPTAPLANGAYQVRLTPGLAGTYADNSGIHMQAEYSFSFVVGLYELWLPLVQVSGK